MAKEKYISIRVSEKLYDKLQKESKLYGFGNFSNYVREKLEIPYISDDLKERDLYQMDNKLRVSLNQEIVRLNYNIERISGNSELKGDMGRRTEIIWRLLNQ